jgi:leader peptidase (prepilin peptidase) / N-methyltransferase
MAISLDWGVPSVFLLLLAAAAGLAAGAVVRVRVHGFRLRNTAGTTAEIRPSVPERPRWGSWSIPLILASLFVLAAWRVGVGVQLPVQLVFLAAAVELSVLDLRHRLLPNATVLPALAVCAGLAVIAALATGRPELFLQGALGAVALFLLYLVLALISPASLGMGDVKLAALIGLVLGLHGWQSWFAGTFWGFLAGALAALAVVAFRRGSRRTSIPFGPAMLAGATAALLLT